MEIRYRHTQDKFQETNRVLITAQINFLATITLRYNCLYPNVMKLISLAQHEILRNQVYGQLLALLHNIGQKLVITSSRMACNSVDHQVLVKKLKSYGLTERLLDWFNSLLSCFRIQKVPVTYGVPEGSTLCSLLFVVFINSLPEIIPNETNSFLRGWNRITSYHLISGWMREFTLRLQNVVLQTQGRALESLFVQTQLASPIHHYTKD